MSGEGEKEMSQNHLTFLLSPSQQTDNNILLSLSFFFFSLSLFHRKKKFSVEKKCSQFLGHKEEKKERRWKNEGERRGWGGRKIFVDGKSEGWEGGGRKVPRNGRERFFPWFLWLPFLIEGEERKTEGEREREKREKEGGKEKREGEESSLTN